MAASGYRYIKHADPFSAAGSYGMSSNGEIALVIVFMYISKSLPKKKMR